MSADDSPIHRAASSEIATDSTHRVSIDEDMASASPQLNVATRYSNPLQRPLASPSTGLNYDWKDWHGTPCLRDSPRNAYSNKSLLRPSPPTTLESPADDDGRRATRRKSKRRRVTIGDRFVTPSPFQLIAGQLDLFSTEVDDYDSKVDEENDPHRALFDLLWGATPDGGPNLPPI